MPEALAHDLPKTMDTIRNLRSWDMHGNGARVPAPWPAPEFRVLETRQTLKSLVPATFPQLPRSKTWFLACCWCAIVYSKTCGF